MQTPVGPRFDGAGKMQEHGIADILHRAPVIFQFADQTVQIIPAHRDIGGVVKQGNISGVLVREAQVVATGQQCMDGRGGNVELQPFFDVDV